MEKEKEKEQAGNKRSSVHVKVEEEEEEEPEVIVLSNDEDDESYDDDPSPPRRKPRIATPSPPKTKRDALRRELSSSEPISTTPPRDRYRIEKPVGIFGSTLLAAVEYGVNQP